MVTAFTAAAVGLSIIAAGAVNHEPDSKRQTELQQILAQNCTVSARSG
jgi:hypothetical protein